MKIARTLLLTLEYPPMVGGVAHYYANLVQHLPAGDVFVLDNEKHELLSESRFVWPKWLKGLWNTYKAIRRYNIECIIVGQVLPLGTIALFFSRFMGIPYIVVTHGMDVTTPFAAGGSLRKQKLIRMIFGRAARVITVSAYTKSQLVQIGVPEKQITLVYPCANTDVTGLIVSADQVAELNSKYQLGDRRVVLSVGRLVERKGFDMVIAAMSSLHTHAPDVAYVIVGEGHYRTRLEALIHQYHLESCVYLVGSVSHQELAAWYTRSTCVVMPSRELPNHDVEGFGIAFLEANTFGKPVIGGKSGGVVDAVVDGETGFLVDPTDLAMITKAIKTLLDQPDLAGSLGKQGQQRVRDTFSWTAQAKKVEKLIGTLSKQ